MSSTDDTTTLASDALIYGLISITIVSILPLGAAVIVPLFKTNAKHRYLSFFVSMAISTLSADAFLHIIPTILGLHDHHSHAHSHEHDHHHDHNDTGNHSDHHDHDHDHNHTHVEHHNHSDHEDAAWYEVTSERMILLKLSTILLSIYILYFVEFVIFRRSTKNHRVQDSSKNEEYNNNLRTARQADSASETSSEDRTTGGHELVKLEENADSEAKFCGLKSRAFIILFGDGIHNLLDGIAVGSSFLISYQLGLITTIAVVFHELPHELGDMAVLIDSGLSVCVALLLNLLSALTAYIGLFIALMIGRNDGAETVLLSLTCGMFLYVAWVDMLSHLKTEDTKGDAWPLSCFIQFCGFAVGFILIFSIGWFEHLLH